MKKLELDDINVLMIIIPLTIDNQYSTLVNGQLLAFSSRAFDKLKRLNKVAIIEKGSPYMSKVLELVSSDSDYSVVNLFVENYSSTNEEEIEKLAKKYLRQH